MTTTLTKECKKECSKEKKRIDYIDIFRAIGIILMIMSHVKVGIKFDFFIHAFNMPMFFFISGLFYKKTEDDKKLIIKKLKSLIVPYIIFGILHYIIWLITNNEEPILGPLYSLLVDNTEGLPIAGALWFLTALFFTEIIYFCIDKINNKVIKNIVIIALSLFGNIETIILPIRLPYGIGIACAGVGLFHIGHLLQKNKENKFVKKIINLNIFEIIILFIIVYNLIFLNTYVDMRIGKYGIIPLFWINSISAIILGINISKHIDKLLKCNIKDFIISIGKNSIVYVCLNQLVYTKIEEIIYNIVKNQALNFTSVMIIKCIIIILTIIIIYICNFIIQHTELKRIIGK